MQLPQAEVATCLLRSNADGRLVRKGKLHEIVAQNILSELADWDVTLSQAVYELPELASCVLQVGPVNCISRRLIHEKNLNIMRTRLVTTLRTISTSSVNNRKAPLKSMPNGDDSDTAGHYPPEPLLSTPQTYPKGAIAIVGMACRFPGANTTQEFWNLLQSGKSMLSQMPECRLKTKDLKRSQSDSLSSGKLRWWGNFVDDIEAFDHRFFRKSAREAASMDPQQRLLIECCYQAVESSGYFADLNPEKSSDIGCFIGVCSNDYNDNIACHAPNAYSSLGSLRAFLSGKLSHYFGWTGPAITYDTACSSSSVAIDAACRSIRDGTCSAAIAGGAALYSSPFFYENLAAASFLSPSGPCKPFDASADGYCRGEGVGLVMLKELNQAIDECDNILGVITASAVNQNYNDTNITVPHLQSQVELYQKVLSVSDYSPLDVSFVEAHGTGTKAGDPVEMQSIRHVFGSRERTDNTFVSSVKGNIGHLEGASGVAALIKVLLMMKHGIVPPQANHQRLNPTIAPLTPDHLAIPCAAQPWSSNFRVACVNNYGAAGSNAALLVAEAPALSCSEISQSGSLKPVIGNRFPLFISANSKDSLIRYLLIVKDLVDDLSSRLNSQDLLSSLAFNLAQQQNQSLPYQLTAPVSDLPGLHTLIESTVSQPDSVNMHQPLSSKPVVLCFGGQTGTTVTLPIDIYNSCFSFRRHLHQCDATIRELGYGTILSAVFDRQPIDDIVKLHCMLFSVQYASAQAWIDAGIRPSSLIGHSFGQLTALAVSETISLRDGLRFVAGRAELIIKHWKSERGSMVSLDADINATRKLVDAYHKINGQDPVEIACYNGTKGHVLVGSQAAIIQIDKMLANDAHCLGITNAKKLDIPYGFHSRLTEPLLADLKTLAETLTFKRPKIHTETCSDQQAWSEVTPCLLAEHTREPVYFGQAVKRLAERFGSCTWLDTGFASPSTGMIRRALEGSTHSAHTFHTIRPTQSGALESLCDVTIGLWNLGHQVQYWPFHRLQKNEYSTIDLPPYQFEKTRHWLDWVESNPDAIPQAPKDQSKRLLSFVKFSDSTRRRAEFVVGSEDVTFRTLLSGHAVLSEALCPAPLYIELALMALDDPRLDASSAGLVPMIEHLEIACPLGLTLLRRIRLFIEKRHENPMIWNFEVRGSSSPELDLDSTLHASGVITLQKEGSHGLESLCRYERLLQPTRLDLIRHDDSSSGLRGNAVYQAFSRVVDYAAYYKGVRTVFSNGNEAVGDVCLPPEAFALDGVAVLEALHIDNFIQVAGLHANCLGTITKSSVYVCTNIAKIQFKHRFTREDRGRWWTVYSTYSNAGTNLLENDIYVLDRETRILVLVIFGARFVKISIKSLTKTLSSANAGAAPNKGSQEQTSSSEPRNLFKPDLSKDHSVLEAASGLVKDPFLPMAVSVYQNTEAELRQLLSDLTDIPSKEFRNEESFDKLGIDSLMITELYSELRSRFKSDLSLSDFQNLGSFGDLVRYFTSGTTSDSSSSKSYATNSLGLASSASSVPKEAMISDDKSNLNCQTLASQAELYSTQHAFDEVRTSFETHATETGFIGFWSSVYPLQKRLVLAYVVEAFQKMGCHLASIAPGDAIPQPRFNQKHQKLIDQMWLILKDSIIALPRSGGYFRTSVPLWDLDSTKQYQEILATHPDFAPEHKLLHVTGSKLAECLTGAADPLNLLFGNPSNKDLLAQVYAKGPMYRAISITLGDFLKKAFTQCTDGRLNILEVGAGTGGTTKYIVNTLTELGINFSYTFTDISGSLVKAAERALPNTSKMDFSVLDIEKPPPSHLKGHYHAIISTNCIHATRDLSRSLAHMSQMLRPDGFVSLVEFTRNIFWFDLVFGLLNGWWNFEDGRQHVLADEWTWHKSMKDAGFNHVTWTDGSSQEAHTLRILTGFLQHPEPDCYQPRRPRKAELPFETKVYKQCGDLNLFADIYFPAVVPAKKMPVGMILEPAAWCIDILTDPQRSCFMVAGTSCIPGRTPSTPNRSGFCSTTASCPSVSTIDLCRKSRSAKAP